MILRPNETNFTYVALNIYVVGTKSYVGGMRSLCYGHEIICCGNEILCRGNEILCRRNEIIMSWNEIVCRWNEILSRGNEMNTFFTWPPCAVVKTCFKRNFECVANSTIYEGCSNMNASSFITFFTYIMYMLRQNGKRFYNGPYATFQLAAEL